MSLFYSAARNAFFDSEIHRDLPGDAQPITHEQHARMMAGQAEGKRICPDRHGRPTLQAPATRPIGERIAVLQQRAQTEARRRILAIASLEQQSNDNAAIALLALRGDQPGAPQLAAEEAVDRRDRIDAIRRASNALELQIAGLGARALSSFDVTSPTHWPS